MNMKINKSFLLMVLLGQGTEILAQNLIKMDGSSAVYPITEAVSEEFQKVDSKTRTLVGVSGTGAGFTKFCKGEIDIQNASRPIALKEMADCKSAGISFLELPVAYDALTVVVNSQNTWMTESTFEELKKIWEPSAKGVVMKWSDIRKEFPSQPLKLFGAASDSGTFDYFIESVVGKSKDKTKQSRSDYTANEDYNSLVQGIMKEKNAFGYIPFAYFEANRNKLKALSIAGRSSPVAVSPSAEAVVSAKYPLARPIFIYVSIKSFVRPEVKRFVEFYLESAPTLVPQVNYVPLSKMAADQVKEVVSKSKVGTLFEGEHKVGHKLEALLKAGRRF
jgi:phosphate transport system substrate-binding protein